MGTSPSNINFGGDLVRIPQWASVAESGGKEGRLQPLCNGSAAVLDDNCYRTTSPAFAASTRKSEGPGRARGRPRFDIIAAEIPHSPISTGLLRVSQRRNANLAFLFFAKIELGGSSAAARAGVQLGVSVASSTSHNIQGQRPPGICGGESLWGILGLTTFLTTSPPESTQIWWRVTKTLKDSHSPPD